MKLTTVIRRLHRSLIGGRHHAHDDRQHRKSPSEMPISDLHAGGRGSVVRIQTNNGARLHKLTAMGLLPGMPVELMQRYPSYLIKVGQTQLAIDREMALAIYVRPHEASCML